MGLEVEAKKHVRVVVVVAVVVLIVGGAKAEMLIYGDLDHDGRILLAWEVQVGREEEGEEAQVNYNEIESLLAAQATRRSEVGDKMVAELQETAIIIKILESTAKNVPSPSLTGRMGSAERPGFGGRTGRFGDWGTC